MFGAAAPGIRGVCPGHAQHVVGGAGDLAVALAHESTGAYGRPAGSGDHPPP